MHHIPIERIKERSLQLCLRIADNRQIIAACLYGPLVSGYGDKNNHVDILLVLNHFGSRLKTYQKSIDERNAFFLVVDQSVFQKDVSEGRLGEITADNLLTPYEPLSNSHYLWDQEVALKKRVIWELLEALVLEFPELSQVLLIKQEYFMYETQMQRARLFSPIKYRFLNIMRSDMKEKNVESMMRGYRKALEELSQEKWINITNGMVKVTPELVKAIKSQKTRFPMVLKLVQRMTLRYIFSILPKMMAPLKIEEIHARTHFTIRDDADLTSQLEDPKNHLLIYTPLGLVPLSDASTIEDFIRKRVPSGVALNVETRQIGGALNSVYQLTLKKDKQEQKIVVKKFKNWTGFKWFPLALWSLGTKSFAVLGKSRLEREYAFNQYLQSQGLTVPKVLYVSPRQSLIFTEFVEGKTLTEVIKKVISAKYTEKDEIELVREAGRRIAEAHRLSVGLGDCKPENIIVTKEGKFYFVDLEQASRDGNQAWDISEFLYYSGHYVSPFAPTDSIELIARTFLEGYIEAGGSMENVKRAASPRYTKVFSIFTQPHVILAISNLCREICQK